MSALSKLEKLMYTIGVVDKATGPVNKIMDKINQLSAQTASAQNQMMSGFMGTAGGAMALVSSLSPAIDHVAALGEVQTLGVASEDLTKLTKTAFEFTAQFGGNSAEFVRSAYDIQSAISGLTGDELASFTKASNVLAVATKADASTITSYMGTMYGIFEKTTNKMGKSDWVNQIAGQTAKAVQMYKTTGAEMQSAFSALGAKAASRGIDAAEQFAVLGELQLVLKSGSVAGTQYAAFIDGIGKAQKGLGIELTDSQGDMLGIDVVLSRINARLAGVGSVARGDILNKAFGSKNAASVVDILSSKTAKLKQGINELTNVTDASKASEMANIIASPWDRFSGSLNGAATAMGQAVLPIIEPVVDMLVAMLGGVIWLTQEFPTLTGVLGAAAVGVIALMMAFSAMNMIIGIYRFALIGLSVVTNAAAISTKLWQVGLVALRVMGFLGNIAVMGAYLAAIGLYRGAMLAAQGVTWLFNTALLANPIGLVIAGVVALVAAVVGLIFYWDAIVAAFKDSSWGQVLIKIFDSVMSVFTGLIDNVKWVLEALGLMDGKEMTINSKVEEVTKTAAPISTENTLSTKLNTETLGSKYLANMNTRINQANGFTPVAANQVLSTEAYAANNLVNTNTQFNQVSGLSPVAASLVESQTFNETNAHSARIQQYQENNQQLAKVSRPRIQRTQYFQQSRLNTNNQSNSSADNSKRVYIDNVVMKSDNLAHDFEQLMELAG
ncbi:Phage tail length tape-measure protein [Moritella sp. JT01]|uniref:phage tail tape measure protein n=1 Tax=Moritella sp. JT01 TaxID=756698 RepID=UPI000798E077|nr:phage tail tape measure protein [Moritella sp. JT01]KXO13275.1 Phage tail length tape-measure protein [Moritella sp. JT01]